MYGALRVSSGMEMVVGKERMLNLVFFFKQKTADEVLRSLVGSEMCIRDRCGCAGGVGEMHAAAAHPRQVREHAQCVRQAVVDLSLIHI